MLGFTILDCICSGQDGKNRSPENQKIEGQRPIFDVIQIVFDPPADLLDRCRLAPPSVHLRPAGNARLYAVAYRVVTDRAGIRNSGRTHKEQPAIIRLPHPAQTGTETATLSGGFRIGPQQDP